MSKKLKDYLDDFDTYTSKASEVNRQLAFAGIAIIWLFKNPEGNKSLFTHELITPLFCLIISLSLDLFQYLLGSIIWGIFFEIKERQINKGEIKDNDIKANRILSYAITFFFVLKIIAMCIAYYFLLAYLLPKL